MGGKADSSIIGGVESIIIQPSNGMSSNDDDEDNDDDDVGDGEILTIQNSSRDVINVNGHKTEPIEKKDDSKDSCRQNCITALRKLTSQGSISPKQKRTLLTDIIIKSSTGEYSLVEVAYDLLC